MTDKDVIKQYRFLLEQIAALSAGEFADSTLCPTHLMAIHKLSLEALAIDGTSED